MNPEVMSCKKLLSGLMEPEKQVVNRARNIPGHEVRKPHHVENMLLKA